MYHESDLKFPNSNPTAALTARQQARAADRGHVCVYPQKNELFLDIDSFDGLGHLYAALEQNSYIKSIVADAPLVASSPSKKAGRFHVRIRLAKTVDKFERITLQALLGSDLSRELLSYQEAQAGCNSPTVFFEKAPGVAFASAVPSPDDAFASAVPSPDDAPKETLSRFGKEQAARACTDPDKMNGAADQFPGSDY